MRVTIQGIKFGSLLDRQRFWLRDKMEHSGRPSLCGWIRVFPDTGMSSAIIGGCALQIHEAEARTTLDEELPALA